MNLLDQRLYDAYCDPILLRAENFDESLLRKLFDSVNLEASLHNKLLDALLEFHYQWSLDAFAIGLHLGLSLHAPRSVSAGARPDPSIEVPSPIN